MRKISGYTLVEVLMALFVLGIVIPTSLGALGNTFMAELKVHESAYLISSAEWWFSRFTFAVSEADINAAPKVDMHGVTRFDWETENLDDGAIMVTLRVYGRLPGPPLTIKRVL